MIGAAACGPIKAPDAQSVLQPTSVEVPCRRNTLLAHLHTHSITSSARASKVGGIVRPSALAVRAFRTSSSLSDCGTIGMLPGSPQHMLEQVFISAAGALVIFLSFSLAIRS